MAYVKTTWVDGQLPAINAENLNKIENGIKNNEDLIGALSLSETPKGTFTPTALQEYPLTPTVSDSWYISGLTGAGYLFTAGDLSGQTADNFDKLIYTATGWYLVEDTQNYVHNTGNETIAGVKTFSSSPIVPDPTTAQQVVSKNYADTTFYSQTEIDTAVAARRKLYAKEPITITPTADTDYTLTAAENLYGRLLLADGSWTADHNIIVDTSVRDFIADNTNGTYNATVKTAAGTGIKILAGNYEKLYCDGTNVISLEHNTTITLDFGTVVNNNRYVVANPFFDGVNDAEIARRCIAKTELLLSGKWTTVAGIVNYGTSILVLAGLNGGSTVDGIIVQTAIDGVAHDPNISGRLDATVAGLVTSASCRVTVKYL